MLRTQKGFTLIELMIVVVIIGILAAIAIPNFIAMQNRAKEGSTKANMHTVQLAAEDYGVQNDGVYAATMDGAHIGDLLPANFQNPFSTTAADWENAWRLHGTPDGRGPRSRELRRLATTQYNIKGNAAAQGRRAESSDAGADLRPVVGRRGLMNARAGRLPPIVV